MPGPEVAGDKRGRRSTSLPITIADGGQLVLGLG